MSAIGPKRTSLVALHMSAFGGKADMTVCGKPLSRSLLGAKRTCPFALHMSATDPKRTFGYGCGSPANLSVFHDFSRGVAARMALKGALVVVGCVRLDPSKPHRCAEFSHLGGPKRTWRLRICLKCPI